MNTKPVRLIPVITLILLLCGAAYGLPWANGHQPSTTVPKCMAGPLSTSAIWFGVRGSTAHVYSVYQGQEITWAANCQTNDVLHWEIWVDTNRNGQFDSIGPNRDMLLGGYSVANGDTANDNGLPDTTAVPDNEIVCMLKMGFAPALYFFKATSQLDGSAARDSCRLLPMPSPWATVSGHVHVPGDSSLQKNLWVAAGLPGDDRGPMGWSTLTDDDGNYVINFDNAIVDSIWEIGDLSDVFGASGAYVAPGNQQLLVTAGSHPGVNFSYQAATDSITGDVTIYGDGPLPFSAEVRAQGTNDREKSTQTYNGHYQLFFAPSDAGTWRLNMWIDTPDYMYPSNSQEFNPVGAGHIIKNYVVYPADDSIKGRVTEQGGSPTRFYNLYAWSNTLQASGDVTTDAQGYYMLRVSSLDTAYNVNISTGDNQHPIPSGWIATPSGYNNINPPATGINFNLTPATEFIQGQISQDPGDAQAINYNEAGVNAWPSMGGNGFETHLDGSGFYNLAVTANTYNFNAWSNGSAFLFYPNQYQNVVVSSNQTVTGKNFIANFAHCRVVVTLSGYPSGQQSWLNAQDGNGWPNGYQTGINVNNPGTYNIYICNSFGWTLHPPYVNGYNVSPQDWSIGNIAHSDTLRTGYTFLYTPVGVEGKPATTLPTKYALLQNQPNPSRGPTEIGYQLPAAARVTMSIYNILGQPVKTVDLGTRPAGTHSLTWDGRDDGGRMVAGGVYFYRLQAGSFTAVRRLQVVR